MDLFDYDNESTSTVFRDVIFLALMGFVAITILLWPHINPPEEAAKEEIPPPGNVIVEMYWDDNTDVDMDLWLQGPDDKPVGYSSISGKLFNLLRDDLGFYNDKSNRNYEIAFSRGVPEGEYTINVMFYANRYGANSERSYNDYTDYGDGPHGSRPRPATPKRESKPPVLPIEVIIVVSIKKNDHFKATQVLKKTVELHRVSQEITVFNFTLDKNKNIKTGSINEIYRPLAGSIGEE